MARTRQLAAGAAPSRMLSSAGCRRSSAPKFGRSLITKRDVEKQGVYGRIQSERADVEGQVAVRHPAEEDAGDRGRGLVGRGHGYGENGWPQATAQPAH